MSVQPNSTIYLLKGCDLDKGYNHTFYWSGTADEIKQKQYEYFISLAKPNYGTFLQNTYQRSGKNSVRLQVLCDNIYDCNYIMFQNTNYGTKWFYAFIDEIKYINDNCTEIIYTIDDMQTWYTDYDLGECFVEREHSETDAIGDNICPEALETGDLIIQGKRDFTFPDIDTTPNYQFAIVIYYIGNNGDQIYYDVTDGWKVYKDLTRERAGNISNGIYGGYDVVWFGIDTSSTAAISNAIKHINSCLKCMQDNSVNIVKITQMPYAICKYYWGTPNSTITPSFHDLPEYNAQVSVNSSFLNTYSGERYIPKNQKLFTSPYVKLLVSNNQGDIKEYLWENFTGKYTAKFVITGTPMPTPEITCYPTKYRGIENDYENSVDLTNFPDCAWNEDTFSKWWAQNKSAFTSSLLTNSIRGLWQKANGNYLSGGTTLLSTVSSAVSSYLTQKNTLDNICGNLNTTSIAYMQNRLGYTFYIMGLKGEYAKIIDDYFTMFGYATNRLKVPNIKNPSAKLRPHWNYIKTAGTIIHSSETGGLPADAENNIAKIYENGITFWTKDENGFHVGDYSLDNSPVQGVTKESKT